MVYIYMWWSLFIHLQPSTVSAGSWRKDAILLPDRVAAVFFSPNELGDNMATCSKHVALHFPCFLVAGLQLAWMFHLSSGLWSPMCCSCWRGFLQQWRSMSEWYLSFNWCISSSHFFFGGGQVGNRTEGWPVASLEWIRLNPDVTVT